MFITIILFLLILAILIFVHELGHFSVAKFFGIRVDEFGLGFPPKIFSKKYGETLYTLNAIPFGGFVKIFGENGETNYTNEIESKDDSQRSFANKPSWIQGLVLVAGVSMNILFGYLLISIGFMIGLPAPAGISVFGDIQNPQVVVTSVLQNSPAQKAGIIGGDVIMSVSADKNTLVEISPDKVSDFITENQGPITVVYKRGEQAPQTVSIKPVENIMREKAIIGISMETIGILKLSPIRALLQGAITSFNILKDIVHGLFYFFSGLFNSTSNFSDVSGPIGIARVIGEARSIGFVYILSIVALISFNLAVINLIPFPALDGGRLLFIGIEAIIRRKINPTVTQWVNGIGFALLIILMIVVTTHDVLK